MKGHRYKPTGWRGESHRHYLAAKGVKTKTFSHKAGKQAVVHSVPIYADKVESGRVYPVSPQQVKKVVGRMDAEDVRGLKAIEFVNPKGEQKRAWGQYVRSRKTVLIFSQSNEDGKLDGKDPVRVQRLITGYVLPHEIGHHKALSQMNITDKDLAVAEARADANVVGMAPNDRDIHMLKN